MKLFSAMLADFTDEDWQEVKNEIKEFIVDQFKEMWEENYIWDLQEVEDLVADHCNDFVEDQFKKLLNQKDMKLFLMQEMLKQVNKKVEEWKKLNANLLMKLLCGWLIESMKRWKNLQIQGK